MSVTAYVGLPGSGKSYTVVEQQVLPALKAGRVVCTNLPLKRDLILAELGVPSDNLREVSAESLQANPDSIFEAVPPGAILVLDEVWRLFPSGLTVSKIPDPFKAFFAEHRHRVNAHGDSSQIVLVTQDLAQVAAFARQLVETTFRTTKLTSVGFDKRYRTDVFNGPVTGPNPSVQSALRQIFGKYRKEVFRYYVSHTQSQAGEGGANEASVDRRGNLLLRPLLFASPFIVVGLVVAGVWGLKSHRLGASVGSAARSVGVGASRAAGVVASPAVHQVWRVSAWLPGLCVAGRCGWAFVQSSDDLVWVPLYRCKAFRLAWRCPAPGGGWAESSGLPAPPVRSEDLYRPGFESRSGPG